VARFTFSPATPGLNEVVSFSASTSTVTGGTFIWDFGDGVTGSGVAITHQYPRAATFTVTLTVTSDTGVVSIASRTLTVSTTLPPNAATFTISPTVPAINQDVFFNASTSIVIGGAFAWDFGDGGTGSGVTVTHRYSRAGTFTVTLRVTNNVGQSAATSRAVSVAATSAQVVANFTFSPTTPGINQDVFFNATASVPSNATFTWNFGDGSTGSGVTPTHRYSQAGTYSVTLTVTNDVGQSSTTARNVPVSATSTSIVADFSFSPTDPTISRGTNMVFFDATPSSPAVTTWTWDFGDGSVSGTGQKTTHTYLLPGTWVARLTVGDSAGRTATTTKNVTVCGSISTTGGCAP
jgi:PKD repeat protein